VQKPAEDRCPGVLRLHPAEDGHLARVRLPGGMLTAGRLCALGEAAELGSGIVELTSRAGVQIRGLSLEAAAAVESLLTAGGLVPSPAHDRVRNILASPLAGRHPASLAPIDGIVLELDRLICGDPDLARLPGRFVFQVDDASGIGWAGTADVTLRAVPTPAGHDARFELDLGGLATGLLVSRKAAGRLAVAAAKAFLAARAESATDVWGVGDLPRGPAELLSRLTGSAGPPRLGLTGAAGTPPPAWPVPAAPPAPRAPAARRPSEVGVTEQPDGRRAICALARLGRLDRRQLDGLAGLCRAPGGIRVSPWKTITVLDVPADDVPATVAGLESLGLVVSAKSPWVGLSACAGVGACASARIDVRGLAGRRAAGGRLTATEHWSGCERRCGEPADAQITVAPSGGLLTVRVDADERQVAGPAEALAILTATGR
jgi:precorrin-3B synthase